MNLPELPIPTVLHGDCIEVMRTMEPDSIDAIVTDPPYGLGFMGKAWDALPPGKEWAEECLRVLKPGGHILAFGGSRTWHRLAVAIEDAGFEIRDSIFWIFGSGFPKHRAGLKPASEPIVMGRKPYKGSLTANEATYGTGALNIDGCRIDGAIPVVPQPKLRPDGRDSGHALGSGVGRNGSMSRSEGRWPANVILDEHTAELLDQQSGVTRSTVGVRDPNGTMGYHGGAAGLPDVTSGHSDSGGASRFFYVAKAPKKERPNVDGIVHTTVKPLTLMRHLIKLVTPVGGTVLDTFGGSGTTAEAAMLEGYASIIIEREAEYLPLIQHRIDRVTA